MDPVSMIVNAIVVGAATGAGAGLQSTTEQVVTNAYESLKAILASKFTPIDISPIEQNPGSKARRAVVAEDLELLGGGADLELLAAAQRLLQAASAEDEVISGITGIVLQDLVAGRNITIQDIVSDCGIRIIKARAENDIQVSNARVIGTRGSDPN